MPAEEKELIKRVAQRDMEAMRLLYEQNKNAVYRYALSLLRDSGVAEDITQEVFIRVLQHADQYRLESSPKTWIMSIARNTALRRRQKIMREADLIGSYEEITLLEDRSAAPESDSFYDIIASLDAQTQEIITLHIAGSLKFREISLILNLTESAVRKRFSRAMKLLKRHFMNN